MYAAQSQKITVTGGECSWWLFQKDGPTHENARWTQSEVRKRGAWWCLYFTWLSRALLSNVWIPNATQSWCFARGAHASASWVTDDTTYRCYCHNMLFYSNVLSSTCSLNITCCLFLAFCHLFFYHIDRFLLHPLFRLLQIYQIP